VLVALGKAGACREQVSLGVGGNCCVAIDDEVAMRSDLGGVNLRYGGRREKRKKEGG
jgi:hypothetical protein